MSKLVLVVDDDPDIQETLRAILEYAEYAVDVASDGLAALKRLEGHHRPHLILLDIMMPRMDGISFLQEFRRRQHFDLPILVLSANPRTKQQALQLGVQGFLNKPFDMDHILMTIEALI